MSISQQPNLAQNCPDIRIDGAVPEQQHRIELESLGRVAIICTERGLTIAGTRITIYDVMDHLVAGWTLKLIRNWLPLTEEQLNAALSYIDANRSEVEAEYQTVLQEIQDIREYWEDKNLERLAQIAKMPPKPGQEEIHAKLQAWKAKLGMTA